jgi:hypothetical protein
MRPALLLGPMLLLGACLDHDLGGEDAPGALFIALQRDFGPMLSWSEYPAGVEPLEGHPPGSRVLHVNHLPDPGSSTFPVGTVIAKSVQEGPRSQWLIHAMVKRGGDYNRLGARGWEWFELQLNDDDVPIIIWRGETPPNGERYGCLTGDCEDAPDCNQCHQDAIGNDFVMSSALELEGL